MLVFISGMPRSGSTYSFNVIKRALSRRGDVVGIASDTRTPLEEATHTIYKAHHADDELLGLILDGSAKSICTIRKPENAVLSWLNTFGGEPDQMIDSIMLPWMHLYERIAQHSLILSMEEIEARRLRSTWKIGRYVCPDYSLLELTMDYRKLSKRRIEGLLSDVEDKKRKVVDAGVTYYDADSFFHRRHISDRSKFDMRPEVLSEIRRRLAPWLDRDGNLVRLS